MKYLTFSLFLPSLFILTNFNPMPSGKFYQKLANYTSTLESEFDQIPYERKKKLADLGEYIYKKSGKGENVSITVICTHNSRRSHMGQLWIDAAAAYYGIDGIRTASGGTGATAFNPRAVDALQDAGFRIQKVSGGENPAYNASFGPDYPDIHMFSKTFDHRMNPTEGFAAVMVCSEADAACPVVPGADARFSIPFEDPKYADGTPGEETAYSDCCRQIAREMFYAVHSVKNTSLDMERSKGEIEEGH